MLEKVAKILRDYKENDSLVVTAETTFEELELDSLDTVELVMNIEDEFGVSIEMNESIKSVGGLLSALENAQAAQ